MIDALTSLDVGAFVRSGVDPIAVEG